MNSLAVDWSSAMSALCMLHRGAENEWLYNASMLLSHARQLYNF